MFFGFGGRNFGRAKERFSMVNLPVKIGVVR
jgi:hypothetical protein